MSEDDVLKDIITEPDCSYCGGPCTGCKERLNKATSRFVVGVVIFMVILFGSMIITL